MATATNSSNTAANHSPRHSVSAVAAENANQPVNSPRARRGKSSPWTQIVRGDPEQIVAAAPSSPSVAAVEQAAVVGEDEGLEGGNGGANNGNAGKKPAWNKPSNGTVEIGAVMGGSWPALGESARAASSKSSSDSLKGLSDGASSVSISQGTGSGSGTESPPLQKQVSNNANANPTPNHTVPTRQRSMKRNGGNTSSNGGNPQQTVSQGPAGDVHLNNPSPRDHAQRSSQSRGTNDHQQQQRNSFRNRNGGPHSRGDGNHPHNYGGRRDQDRGNQDWSGHRNFNGRDAHMQPQRVVQRFMRHPPPPPPPPTSTAFIQPPPVRPFASPMGFPELASPVYYVAAPPPDSIRGVPFVAAPMPPHPMFFPPPDLQLHARIVNQIDYYFSNENLIKDTFLRQNMDEHGWVPIKLIAGFNKVYHLTDNIQFILDAVRSSTVVEVQGDKVRRRNDWLRWIMPPSVQFPNASGPQSPLGNSHQDMLSNPVQSISLEEKATGHGNVRSQTDVNAETFLGRSTSGDLSSQSQQSINEEVGQISVQGGLDHATSTRNIK